MRPSIRDETGSAIFDVAPTPILLWATNSWKSTEVARIAEFVLVSSEVEAARIEEVILTKGGARFGPSGNDSQIIRSTDGRLVCIVSIERDYSRAQRDFRISEKGRMRTWYSRLKYWLNVHRVILREANRALSAVNLLAAHHDSTISVDELWYRERELRLEADRRYFKRLVTSRLLPASFLAVFMGMLLRDKFALTFHGMEQFEHISGDAQSSYPIASSMKHEDSRKALDDFEIAPLGDREATRESDSTWRNPTKIRDESGEKIAGVDPAQIFAWGLSAFARNDSAKIREIIVVSDESAIDSIELELMLRGAYPIHRRTPKSRTYTLQNGGALQIVNIGRMRQRVIEKLKKSGVGWFGRRHVSLAYRTRLKLDALDELQLGVASAKLAVLQREGSLPDSEVEQKYSALYLDCWGPVMTRTWCSTLLPSVFFLIAVEILCRLWRSSQAEEKGPET